MPRRTVAVVGMAALTREMANLEPPNVELWGLKAAYKFLTHSFHRWFEIHTRDEDGMYRGYDDWSGEVSAESYFNFLCDCGVPVYMREADSKIPTSVAFPFSEIGAKYRPYWTSTVSYMLSLAAYEKVDELHLWGVDIVGGSEFEQQRPCIEYWLGVLETQGCEILIPDVSPVLKPLVGSTYGSTRSRVINAGIIRDELSGLDTHIIRDELSGKKVDPELTGSRKTLVRLLNMADADTRGKEIEPAVMRGSEINAAMKSEMASFISRMEERGQIVALNDP